MVGKRRCEGYEAGVLLVSNSAMKEAALYTLCLCVRNFDFVLRYVCTLYRGIFFLSFEILGYEVEGPSRYDIRNENESTRK